MKTRTRFEIFKRDNFTCLYCGRKSPDVVLEVDHIVPRSKNGEDDPINLVTSCFECNRGKSDKNLSEIVTGEDPHDRAIELLEKERQLLEYDKVKRKIEKRIESDWRWLSERWKWGSDGQSNKARQMLRHYSVYDIQRALEISSDKTGGGHYFIQYAYGILRNWKEQGTCLKQGN